MKKQTKTYKTMNKPIIEISIKENGEVETKFIPFDGVNSVLIGIALASATRVISAAFRDMLNLKENHIDQIQAQIAEVYNNDLVMGSMGEEEATRLL